MRGAATGPPSAARRAEGNRRRSTPSGTRRARDARRGGRAEHRGARGRDGGGAPERDADLHALPEDEAAPVADLADRRELSPARETTTGVRRGAAAIARKPQGLAQNAWTTSKGPCRDGARERAAGRAPRTPRPGERSRDGPAEVDDPRAEERPLAGGLLLPEREDDDLVAPRAPDQPEERRDHPLPARSTPPGTTRPILTGPLAARSRAHSAPSASRATTLHERRQFGSVRAQHHAPRPGLSRSPGRSPPSRRGTSPGEVFAAVGPATRRFAGMSEQAAGRPQAVASMSAQFEPSEGLKVRNRSEAEYQAGSAAWGTGPTKRTARARASRTELVGAAQEGRLAVDEVRTPAPRAAARARPRTRAGRDGVLARVKAAHPEDRRVTVGTVHSAARRGAVDGLKVVEASRTSSTRVSGARCPPRTHSSGDLAARDEDRVGGAQEEALEEAEAVASRGLAVVLQDERHAPRRHGAESRGRDGEEEAANMDNVGSEPPDARGDGTRGAAQRRERGVAVADRDEAHAVEREVGVLARARDDGDPGPLRGPATPRTARAPAGDRGSARRPATARG